MKSIVHVKQSYYVAKIKAFYKDYEIITIHWALLRALAWTHLPRHPTETCLLSLQWLHFTIYKLFMCLQLFKFRRTFIPIISFITHRYLKSVGKVSQPSQRRGNRRSEKCEPFLGNVSKYEQGLIPVFDLASFQLVPVDSYLFLTLYAFHSSTLTYCLSLLLTWLIPDSCLRALQNQYLLGITELHSQSRIRGHLI